MPSPQHFLHSLQMFLSSYRGLTFSLGLLLIGLEELIEPNLLCPCRNEWNTKLIALIFVGPLVFTFAIMLALLKPYKHLCDKVLDCVIQVFNCLIPPVMWIIILLIDGDYLACSLTTWEGNYVLDKEINIKWCQPTQLALIGNTSEKRLEYQKNIWKSQVGGYSVLIGLSIIIICFDVCNYFFGKEDGAQGGAQGGAQRGAQDEAQGEAQRGERASFLSASEGHEMSTLRRSNN